MTPFRCHTAARDEARARSVSVEGPSRHFWKVKDDEKEHLPWNRPVTTSWTSRTI